MRKNRRHITTKKNPAPGPAERSEKFHRMRDALVKKMLEAGKRGDAKLHDFYGRKVNKLDRIFYNRGTHKEPNRRYSFGTSRPGKFRKNPSHIRSLPKNVMDKTYTERVKLRGYNGPVTVFSAHGSDAGKVLRKLHPEMTKEEHLDLARKYKKRGYAMDTLHSRLLDRAARQTWGRPWRTTDYRISGIGSDEFSASMKKRLRDANALLNAYSRAARAHEYAAGRRNVV